LSKDAQVVASFKSKENTLTIAKVGDGTVTSAEMGISCGTKCSASYSTSTAGTITAKADPGSTFAGWTGGGCQGGTTCAVLVNSNIKITAAFVRNPNHIGLFRPNTSQWFFDNGNGIFDDCQVDLCTGPFGKTGDLPVTGDWDGSGVSRIGLFNPTTGTWQLDLNGNGIFDGCQGDLCPGPFGKTGDLPVTGD